MRGKKAKQLRRIAMHHPRNPVGYVKAADSVRSILDPKSGTRPRWVGITGRISVSEGSRKLYRDLKKLIRDGMDAKRLEAFRHNYGTAITELAVEYALEWRMGKVNWDSSRYAKA